MRRSATTCSPDDHDEWVNGHREPVLPPRAPSLWLSSDERAAATPPFWFPLFFMIVSDEGEADFVARLRHSITNPSEAVSQLMIGDDKKTA